MSPALTRPRPARSTRPAGTSSCSAAVATPPAVVDKVHKRDGVKADRSFNKTIRGFSAKLDEHQKHDLLADPNVEALVPDEVVHLTAQTIPTGVSRVGGRQNTIAAIDGTDRRVDADVAIVDTGIGCTRI